MKLRTGDTVVIITGKDKGKTGTVLRLMPDKNRVVVGDVNMRTRHVKKTPQRAGSIIRYEASIHASNVMLLDPKTKKRTRIGYVVTEKGKKRVAKRSGEVLAGAARTTAKAQKTGTAGDEATIEKATKAKKTPVDAGKPGKGPFWKKLGFGAEAIEQGEVDDPAHMQQDKSIPGQTQGQSMRTHSRGS